MFATLLILGLAAARTLSISQDLEVLTRDYQADALRQDAIFGIRVDGQDWTVVSGEDGVRLREGRPQTPTFTYVLDSTTFSRIVSGELGSLTAMGQARASDPTPMSLQMDEDFKPDEGFTAKFLSITSHFWTRGTPEMVRFDLDHARTVHGGEAVPLYYAPGIRTAWYGILPGQHINASPDDQINDFDSLFLIIEGGTARMRIGGREMPMADGTSVHVPAGQAHEFGTPGNDRRKW